MKTTNSSGYTILEMIVVITIIGIIAGFLVPLLGNLAPGRRLNGDSKNLLAHLRQVQEASISNQKRHGIELLPDENAYNLIRREVDEGTGDISYQVIESIDLSSGIEITNLTLDGVNQEDNYIILFNSFGEPRDITDEAVAVQITLQTDTGDSKTVEIKKNTGHAEIL